MSRYLPVIILGHFMIISFGYNHLNFNEGPATSIRGDHCEIRRFERYEGLMPKTTTQRLYFVIRINFLALIVSRSYTRSF